MDRESIERVRTATFTAARRGYDKREVDRFLARLADWLESGGSDDSRSQVIRDELKRVGEQTGQILAEAHEVAEAMRSDAESHATNVRSEADAYAERVRIEADEYSKEQRAEADAYIGRIRSEAEAEAAELRDQAEHRTEQIAEEVARRRRQLEAEIAELEERREAVLEDMHRLSSQLVGTASQHRPDPLEPIAEFEDDPDAELAEMVAVEGDDEGPLDAGEAEFEEYEDEVEDGAIAEAGGETMEFNVQEELAEQDGEEHEAR